MTKTLYGKIHGNTIKLEEDLGLAEGQEVEVHIKTIPAAKQWGEGILRTAGALADDPYWDDIMQEVHRTRKMDRRQQAEEK